MTGNPDIGSDADHAHRHKVIGYGTKALFQLPFPLMNKHADVGDSHPQIMPDPELCVWRLAISRRSKEALPTVEMATQIEV
jgi:hypothetical protein